MPVLAPLSPVVRDELKALTKDYDKSEDDLKALQSVGQSIGEVLRQLDEDKCTSAPPCPRLCTIFPTFAPRRLCYYYPSLFLFHVHSGSVGIHVLTMHSHRQDVERPTLGRRLS